MTTMTHSTIYPGADTKTQWRGAGGVTMGHVSKLLLHTTESSGWPAYPTFQPTLTFNPWLPRGKRWRQHLPVNGSASTLADPSSTAVRENRDDVCQVEIVAYCDPKQKTSPAHISKISDDAYAELGELLAWLHREWEVPLKAAASWPAYPASYGAHNGVRLSSDAYDRFTGVLGHMHASGGDHGDPGDLGVAKIMAYAGGTPAAAPWNGETFPGAGAFVLGVSNPAVTVLDQRLVAHGFTAHHDGTAYTPGPLFTENTWANVLDFQKARGWTGAAADGYPGPSTWAALMAPPAVKAPAPPKPAVVTFEAFQLNCQWPGFASTKAVALPWSKRLPTLVAAVPNGTGIVVAQELGQAEAVEFFTRLGPTWRYARAQGVHGNGLNAIGWDTRQWTQQGDPQEWLVPSFGQLARTLIAVKLKHTDGTRIRPAGTHLAAAASDLRPAAAIAARTAQAKYARSHLNDDVDDWPTLLCWDGNDRTDTGPDAPKPLMRAYGWRTDADQVTIRGAAGDAKRGIDCALTNWGATITAEQIIPLGTGSDHDGRRITFTSKH